MSSKPNAQGLRWDVGGWFGSQLGGTCWMAIGAAVLYPRDAGVATAVLALFVAANGIGILLWRARRRVRPLTGHQALILTVGLTSLSALLTIHLSGLWDAVQIGGRVSPVAMYCLLAVLIPGLLLQMRLLDRRAAAKDG